jgi:molybdate transport system substrate-binding protein
MTRRIAVPCGVVAAEVFKNAAITVKTVTLQPGEKSVLTRVESSTSMRTLVSVIDVMAVGGKAKGVTIPADVNAVDAVPGRYYQQQQA